MRSVLRRPCGEALLLAAVLVLAFGVGFWNQSHARYAAVLATLPLAAALACRLQVPLALGIGALPLQLDVVGGSVHLTLADLLLTFAFAAALPPLLLRPDWRDRVRQVTPLLVVAAPFTAWMVVVAFGHASLGNIFKTGQYFQLFLLPLLLGALVSERRTARLALLLFVGAALVVALLWATTGGHFPFAGQKNPSGQFLTDALILVVALVRSWRWQLVITVPLLVGLAFTQSRGAIVAAGVGVAVLLLLRGRGTWRRTAAAVVPVIIVASLGYQFLPEDVQARATNFTAGDEATSLAALTSAQYALRLREIYRTNGWALVNSHPLLGVGPGNYATGTPGSVDYNTDPHDVVIRTAGDTGYPGLIGYGILVFGSAFIVFRRRDTNPFAVVALAVQAAIIAHGFVDVYWVRGTPVLGWLLIGMALNRRLDGTFEQSGRYRGGLPQRRPPRALPFLGTTAAAGMGDRQLQ